MSEKAFGCMMVALCLSAVITSTTLADVTFTPLVDPLGGSESRAQGVSADGSVVVGYRVRPTGDAEAFRWTGSGGMVGLGDFVTTNFYSAATAASADGSVIVGYGKRSGGGLEAFRWTLSGGLSGLGDLAGGAFFSQAGAVSADGSVVVGFGTDDTHDQAFRWTSATGMVGLGCFAGAEPADRWSYATGISGDGTTIIGRAGIGSGSSHEAFRTVGGGAMEPLGLLGGNATSAVAIAANAAVIAGEAVDDEVGARAFIWTSEGFELLGDLPNGGWSGARAVCADGSMVVGSGASGDNDVAFLWTEENGIRVLQDMLINDYGLGSQLTGWMLSEATGISADGKVITGFGINPGGQTQAWMVQIPEPATLTMLSLGGLAILRRRR